MLRQEIQVQHCGACCRTRAESCGARGSGGRRKNAIFREFHGGNKFCQNSLQASSVGVSRPRTHSRKPSPPAAILEFRAPGARGKRGRGWRQRPRQRPHALLRALPPAGAPPAPAPPMAGRRSRLRGRSFPRFGLRGANATAPRNDFDTSASSTSS